MQCSRCGAEFQEGDRFCSKCGYFLQQKPSVVVVDQGMSGFIPANTKAVAAYYLGVFSLFCFLISIPALVLGILGLNHAKKYPQEKGAVHAWFGVIMGLLGTLLWLGVLVLFICNLPSA